MADAGGQPNAGDAVAVQNVHCPSLTPSTEGDCDELYGDINVDEGYLLLSPPPPSSPPKTLPPGGSLPASSSPAPPPLRTAPPEPQPQLPKPAPERQPTPPPSPRDQPPQRASSGGDTAEPAPPTTALYISGLTPWTTDAEVEAALAPHGTIHPLLCYLETATGKSLGAFRADFLDPGAAASAAAALNGRVFNGRPCVASLSRPPGLPAPAEPRPPPPRASDVQHQHVLDDPPVHPEPFPWPLAPHPHVPPFGGFPFSPIALPAPFLPPMVTPPLNPAFFGAPLMAMDGGGFNMPWPSPLPPMSPLQQYRNWDHGQERGVRRERPSRMEPEIIGDARGGYPQRRDEFGRDEGECSSRDERRREETYGPASGASLGGREGAGEAAAGIGLEMEVVTQGGNWTAPSVMTMGGGRGATSDGHGDDG